MQEYYLFYIVFLSQILLISFYYPRKMHKRMRYVFDTYPPKAYPKMYPKPVEFYEKGRNNYRNINFLILFAGLLILAALMGNQHDGDLHNAIAMGYFVAQMLPVMLLDLLSLRELKLMRNSESRTTRKADLQRRHFFDFVSPTLFSIAVITYIAFVFLIVYLNQFGYEWFGGYWNIFGMTIMNIFFASLLLWHMYGKKLNPHQAHEDRVRQIKSIAKIMLYTSIVATVFISVEISLSALEVRHLLPVFLSMYFQLLAIIGLQAYRIDDTNFDVYKKDSLVT
jgi:hypothetical protein